jgi:hypothetical protein
MFCMRSSFLPGTPWNKWPAGQRCTGPCRVQLLLPSSHIPSDCLNVSDTRCISDNQVSQPCRRPGNVQHYYILDCKGLVIQLEDTRFEISNCAAFFMTNKNQTPWPLVRKRTIPIERPPLVGEFYSQLLWIEGCRMVSAGDPYGL